jgi:hypothetical protein
VDRDVKKSVEEDAKINEHNLIARGAIPTTMCIKGMKSFFYSFMYIEFKYRVKTYFSIVLLQKRKTDKIHSSHKTERR